MIKFDVVFVEFIIGESKISMKLIFFKVINIKESNYKII